MSILCGHCKEHHASVAEVRDCSQRESFGWEPTPEAHPGQDFRREIASKRAASQSIEDGIYRVGPSIFKAYTSIQSGRTLCKRLKMDGQGGSPQWFYEGMAYRFVQPQEKMSLEEAKEFGQIYGVCCRCGRTLTDETSIANGIGPICEGLW